MNITLFPVAAFLLLLSGMGAPAHAAAQGEVSAALMGVLFGRWDAVPAGARVRADPSVQATASARKGIPGPLSGVNHRAVEAGLTRLVQAAPGAFAEKQYRTRFGFAEGAYLALGPPASSRRNGLDWPRA